MKSKKQKPGQKKLPNYTGIDKTIYELFQKPGVRKSYISAAIANGDKPRTIKRILNYYGITC